MRVGIPREVKDGEFRVALSPKGAAALRGVVVEPGAGLGVGFSDDEYAAAGATLADPWQCELIVKVKELQAPEYSKPRRGQVVLSFDQFAVDRALLEAALASGATFISYNTVGRQRGESPILAPMSAIAGRLAVLMGAWCLQRQNGGSGVLLPGFGDVSPGKVVILGAGNVGANALAMAHGIGADVTVHAKTERRFSALRSLYPSVKFTTDEPGVQDADLIIGAVFAPGHASPKLVTRKMLAGMRRGSALVDVGIDHGGIAETSRQTSHAKPIYVEEGVVHYCVPNMPAACPRTASLALERAVLPYVRMLMNGEMDDDLRSGIAVTQGRATAG
ncbi:MAG TPA: alanine dehydrogenase [Burkholderiales bacterium]|nr:alanine dehydrogenase [Burkholderiales bacterium]